MARTKRSRPEAIRPSQFIESLEGDTIIVSSAPPPLPPEEQSTEVKTRCVTASPEAWDEVLRHRKSCKWHRYNALEFTELLDELYAPSMATGCYATTLINRASDSPVLDPLLRAPSSSGKKEEEKEILQGGSYQLIEKVITQLARSRRNVLQQAIDLLEEEYSRKLSSEHMDMALDCLENEAKSSMFSSIKDVAKRDRWLERHAGVEILYE
ncbi:hypothetical protein V1515DRAFT_586583 [Lipomyces mesembrius]